MHPGSHWSGVFYVSTGEPQPDIALNGWFEFYDPRKAATMSPIPGLPYGFTRRIEPEEGILSQLAGTFGTSLSWKGRAHLNQF